MPFFMKDSFDSKFVQKCFGKFKKLDRIKAPHPSEEEILCILCDDSSLLLTSIVFCTNESVYYLTGTGIALNKYDFSSITAVSREVVSGFSSVCLTISNGEPAKLYVATKAVEQLEDYIKSKCSQPVLAPAFSAADEILKYKQLLDCGAITEAEYNAKKRQLLGI